MFKIEQAGGEFKKYESAFDYGGARVDPGI